MMYILTNEGVFVIFFIIVYFLGLLLGLIRKVEKLEDKCRMDKAKLLGYENRFKLLRDAVALKGKEKKCPNKIQKL